MSNRIGRSVLLVLAVVAGVLTPLAAARSHTMSPPAPRAGALPPGLAPVVAATLASPDYHLAPGNAGGWRADNPAQGMAVDFTPEGLRVSPGAGADLGLTLARLGRAGSLTAPEPARVEAAGARIDYRRGAVTEWYVNDHRGVEQGFTLDTAPPGDAGAPLVVELAPAGGMRPALDPAGSSIRFTSPTGGALNYGGLHAFDANGRVLPSRLDLAGDMVTLTVDDAGAAYPVVIDPLVNVHAAWLTPSDGAENHAGYSVGISGDTAVVGALGVDSAYVFVRSGGGWSEQARLPLGTRSDNAFGYSVAIDGDTIVVGAFDTDTPVRQAGAAYVYVRQGGVWTEQAHLLAPNPQFLANFGYAVAVSGDTVLVGENQANSFAGQAHVFVRSGGTWAHQARLAVSPFTRFLASSVALSGDTAVLGQPFVNGPGSVFVFVRSGGAWSQQAELTASDGGDGDHFGNSLGISGETVVVGAVRHIDPQGNAVGSAYAYVRSGGSWVEQARLVPPVTQTGDVYGFSVAISGDIAVVGAMAEDVSGAANAGAAYSFRRTGTTWGPAARYTAPDAGASDQLGWSVAVSGHTGVAGAIFHGPGDGLGRGGAAVFDIIPIASLVLTPSAATVATGSPQSYTVRGLDAGGTDRGDFTSTTTFSITPDGSCAGATCTPAAPGPHTVTATLDGLSATASLTATYVDTTPPVVHVPAPMSVLATGPSGAVVTYTATATDDDPAKPNPPVNCSPASGSTFPIGTTTVTCTSTDAAGNTGTASFTVSVAGARPQFERLIALSQDLGPGKAALMQLQKAYERYLAGDIAGACTGLNDYIKQVTQHTPKQIDAATAAARIADANQIRAVIGC
jgi:hypothetical protein